MGIDKKTINAWLSHELDVVASTCFEITVTVVSYCEQHVVFQNFFYELFKYIHVA